LRRMNLRRGLNILWARPSDPSSNDTRLTGHGAGKTTFCRMIRYILDEATFGTADFRDAFNDTERNGFRNGWALGEVILGGEQWLVGRPLGRVGYQSFAKRNGAITDPFPEHPTNIGYSDYQTALDEAVFGRMKLRTLSGSGNRLEWQWLLGWLSRDQEAHYRSLLEWRHSDSDHQTGEVSFTDRENLVRLVLGLVDKDEQDILRRHAEKAKDHEDSVREKTRVDFLNKRNRERLEALLQQQVAAPNEPVLRQAIEARIKTEENSTDPVTAAATFDAELDRLSEIAASRESEWKIARVVLLNLIARLPKKERDLRNARQEATDAEQQDAIRVMHPFKNYCSQPLSRAWREKCPLADDRPTDEQVDKVLRATLEAVKNKDEEIGQLENQIGIQENLVSEKRDLWQQARKDVTDLRTRRDETLNNLHAPRQRAADLRAAFADYQKSCQEFSDLADKITGLEREKRQLDNQLIPFVANHDRLVQTFGRIFDHFVQYTMRGNVNGTVEFSGKGIEPRVRDHARRDSPAIKVAKFVEFDLSALFFTLATGEGFHPQFLLHDSPRESDLDPGLYRSLFLAVQELETADHSGFQYIVTTTEPPPEEVNRAPWRLEPVLDARSGATRFLGVDL